MPTNTFNYEIPEDRQQSTTESAQYIEPTQTTEEIVVDRTWRSERQAPADQNAQMIEGLGAPQQQPTQNAQQPVLTDQSSAPIPGLGMPQEQTQPQPQPQNQNSFNVSQLINGLTDKEQAGPTNLSVTSGSNGFNYKIDGHLLSDMFS